MCAIFLMGSSAFFASDAKELTVIPLFGINFNNAVRAPRLSRSRSLATFVDALNAIGSGCLTLTRFAAFALTVLLAAFDALMVFLTFAFMLVTLSERCWS